MHQARFEDPAFIDVNTDSVYGLYLFVDHTCIQSVSRQYTVKWFETTGWLLTGHGWTSTPLLQSPYHYAWIENYANFANQAFCDPIAVTTSIYNAVRIILFDNATVSFFADYNSSGDCWYLLSKEWIHQYSAF